MIVKKHRQAKLVPGQGIGGFGKNRKRDFSTPKDRSDGKANTSTIWKLNTPGRITRPSTDSQET